MFRRSLKILFFVLLGLVIVVAGDDETRDVLKGKVKALKNRRG